MEQQHQAKAVAAAAAVGTPASSVSVADVMAYAAGQQLNVYSKG
jgi:hypothetical protein